MCAVERGRHTHTERERGRCLPAVNSLNSQQSSRPFSREELEDLCASAVKEEQIELKLKSVAEEWAAEVFTFAEHKSRGPVVLKVGGRKKE